MRVVLLIATAIQVGTMHSFIRQTDRQGHDQIKNTSREFFSFLSFQYPLLPLSRRTFKLPWLIRLGREVLISLHKIRCAHREPSVDTVIREVVRQAAFQEFVYFNYIVCKFWQHRFWRKTYCVLRKTCYDNLLLRQSIPTVLHFQL